VEKVQKAIKQGKEKASSLPHAIKFTRVLERSEAFYEQGEDVKVGLGVFERDIEARFSGGE